MDTNLLPRLASGRKHETYFPIAVADNKFHCIILKGGDQYPYFPRPLLSEFDFSIPLTSVLGKKKKQKKPRPDGLDDEDEDMVDEISSEENEDADEESPSSVESKKLEQDYLLKGLHATQLADLVDATKSTAGQRAALTRLELEIDKTLLQLLAVECREGEDRGMRALEFVQLMRDRSGRMIEAAGKVADRYGRNVLGEKIREIGEERLGGGGGFGDDDDDDFP